MENKQEWLQERKKYIGGSDIGGILALKDSYKTPLDVYLSKISQEEKVEEELSEPAYWGNRLEDIVAEEYSIRTKTTLSQENRLLNHKEYPFLAANVDRWVNDEYLLECKTAGFMMNKNWGEEESEDIPPSYYAQVAWYSAIANVKKVDIAVLIGGQKFKIYTYNKDTQFEDNLIKKGVNFWKNHVEKRIPPAPVNFDDLKLLYPESANRGVYATEEIERMLSEMKVLKEQEKGINKALDELKFSVQSFMQDNEVLLNGNDKKIATWKSSAIRRLIDAAKLEAEYKEAYKACSKLSSPSRTFLVK